MALSRKLIFWIFPHVAVLVLIFSIPETKGQQVSQDVIDQAGHLLAERGEVFIEFELPPGYHASYFSSFLSVDRVTSGTVIACANGQQFDLFLLQGIPFRVIDPVYKESKGLPPAAEARAEVLSGYPSYEQYIDLMQDFAAQYPDLCRLDTFGQSVEGRKLLALKITDNPDATEREPALLYSSTIHGDEVLGYVLMLRLAQELLQNYGTDDQITNLVDNLEIWINPLSNPDGAYSVSDESVAGATRLNANHVDLNRNFPDPALGDHPDGYAWQPETLAMIDLMKGMQLLLAANFHGGVEVVNYPWDTWSRLHPDDAWYRNISRTYADTAHAYSPTGYMTFLEDGITNGYAWYQITGGKQDYSNYFLYAREVTIELSDNDMPDEAELASYWEYNRRSLLGFMEQALFGVYGQVTDASNGNALRARVFIEGQDMDHSEVFSSAQSGDFYRMLPAGQVTLTFQCNGYKEAAYPVQVPYRDRAFLDVRLEPLATGQDSLKSGLVIYPNPFTDHLFVYVQDPGGEVKVNLYDPAGRMVRSFRQPVTDGGWQQIDLPGLSEGVYFIRVSNHDQVIRGKVIRTAQ